MKRPGPDARPGDDAAPSARPASAARPSDGHSRRPDALHVHEIEPGIIHVREAAALSHKSIDRQRSAIRALTAPLTSYALLLDLTRTARPSVRTHQLWEDALADDKLCFAAAYTGDNVLISMSAKMLLSAITSDDGYQILQTEPLALAAVRHALAGRQAR